MLPIVLALFCACLACEKSQSGAKKNNAPIVMTQADSAIVQSIETYLNSMREKSFFLPKKEYRINVVSERDGALLGMSDSTENAAVMSCAVHLFPDSGAINLTYIFQDGKLIFFNSKKFDPHSEPPHARDLVIYLDEKRIVNGLERYVQLAPGEAPYKLRQLPRKPMRLDRDSLFREINDYYERVMTEVKKTKPVGKS